MARPKKLNTNGDYSVFDTGCGYYELRYKGRFVVCTHLSRGHLYTVRAKYSYWHKRILSVLAMSKSTEI